MWNLKHSEQRTATCGTNLTRQQKKQSDCDTSWNTSMPYPSWPFTRVRGTELEKLERQMRKQKIIDAEEAWL